MLEIRKYLRYKLGLLVNSFRGFNFFELYMVVVLAGFFVIAFDVFIFGHFRSMYYLFVLGFSSLVLLIYRDMKACEISGEHVGFCRKLDKERALKMAQKEDGDGK